MRFVLFQFQSLEFLFFLKNQKNNNHKWNPTTILTWNLLFCELTRYLLLFWPWGTFKYLVQACELDHSATRCQLLFFFPSTSVTLHNFGHPIIIVIQVLDSVFLWPPNADDYSAEEHIGYSSLEGCKVACSGRHRGWQRFHASGSKRSRLRPDPLPGLRVHSRLMTLTQCCSSLLYPLPYIYIFCTSTSSWLFSNENLKWEMLGKSPQNWLSCSDV